MADHWAWRELHGMTTMRTLDRNPGRETCVRWWDRHEGTHVLDITIRRPASASAVCRLDGDLTTDEATGVRALTSWLRDTGTVVVDLRGIARFDRPGVAALIGVLRRLRTSADHVAIAVTLPSMVRFLRSEGLDRLFPIEPAPEELVGSAA
jgi:anti-anti-sigma factor